ncbi:MAG TPA: hypothetical protein VMH50_07540 [Thermoleophilia bacterium]|nr:hypothetical protein [Thermoleophilia bacterium]
MCVIDMRDGRLVVEIEGSDRLWCAARRIVVPLPNVRGAHLDPDIENEAPWIAAGRTDQLLDYAVAAGPMLVLGERDFWDVRRPEHAIVIDLDDQPCSRLVIEVDDPKAAIDAVNAAIAETKVRA